MIEFGIGLFIGATLATAAFGRFGYFLGKGSKSEKPKAWLDVPQELEAATAALAALPPRPTKDDREWLAARRELLKRVACLANPRLLKVVEAKGDAE